MYGKNPLPFKDQAVPRSGGHGPGTGLSFSHQCRGRTFGDGVITVLGLLGWGVFCCFVCFLQEQNVPCVNWDCY